ncbi:Imm21 family immunity protein [Nocardia sp. GAS34]|uniref:Imm21 family immunity protein n=1 Tax=unclassified Nocardia TaxID=2637762 RepID=UPI003D1ADE7F
MDRYQWIETTGGPQILIPQSARSAWRGVPEAFDPDHRDTWGDYGLACSVSTYIGIVEHSGVEVLVLGDMAAPTTYIQDMRMLVRWYGADSEKELLAAANRSASNRQLDEQLTWNVAGPVEFFNSALDGATVSVNSRLSISLDRGRYRVSAAYFDDDWTAGVAVVCSPEAGDVISRAGAAVLSR